VTIPFLDVGAATRELRAELDDAYRRVQDAGWYVLGPEVEAFEREYAAYCGVAHCVTVGNGMDALHLLLRAAGIGAGDEVLVPGHTFIATWLAVSAAGAVPVAVDVDERAGNLDPTRLGAAMTPRTAAVVPVHLHGQPAAMTEITAFARRHRLAVFEDAAQAHGACLHGRRAGSLGDGAAFSFYPTKNLGALGDAGAVTTDDAALAERVRRLRNYGSAVKYHHDEPGTNSRLDELQAAFLSVKLRHLDAWNERRRSVAAAYHEALAGVAGLARPAVLDGAEPVWHLYAVRHRRRDALQRALADAGIGTAIHYPVPPHRSGAYRQAAWGGRDLGVSERWAAESLSLPMGPHLSAIEVARVAECVRRFGAAARRAA
jgi:dTDP-4-amino-4,6-dideoxygalactose transaminase